MTHNSIPSPSFALTSCEQKRALLRLNQQHLRLVDQLLLRSHLFICTECRNYKEQIQKTNKLLASSADFDFSFDESGSAIEIYRRLSSFPELNPSPIIEIDKNENITYQNPAFTKIFQCEGEACFEHEALQSIKNSLHLIWAEPAKQFEFELPFESKLYVQRARYLIELGVIRVFFIDITEQKNLELRVEKKNKQITDSINYARRIQCAMLPPKSAFKAPFADAFILYQPKDIVTGDFYWFTQTETHTLVAVADCTGHGVPGAFMSLICQNALNRSVYEFQLSNPADILSKCRELLTEALQLSNEIVADGMDISLLTFTHKTKKYHWAGANSPLWYSKDGILNKIDGTKQAVGYNLLHRSFESHEIDLQLGSFIFMFSDGYSDQFGGTENKRFNRKHFFELLSASLHLSLDEIEASVTSNFHQWKGTYEQTDDVLVLGIKVGE